MAVEWPAQVPIQAAEPFRVFDGGEHDFGLHHEHERVSNL
jgi:hypothetical protein